MSLRDIIVVPVSLSLPPESDHLAVRAGMNSNQSLYVHVGLTSCCRMHTAAASRCGLSAYLLMLDEQRCLRQAQSANIEHIKCIYKLHTLPGLLHKLTMKGAHDKIKVQSSS